MIDISREKVDLNCPECNSGIKVTLRQVSSQSTVSCHRCGIDIRLNDHNGSARKTIQDINKAFNDLDKAFKRFKR